MLGRCVDSESENTSSSAKVMSGKTGTKAGATGLQTHCFPFCSLIRQPTTNLQLTSPTPRPLVTNTHLTRPPSGLWTRLQSLVLQRKRPPPSCDQLGLIAREPHDSLGERQREQLCKGPGVGMN